MGIVLAKAIVRGLDCNRAVMEVQGYGAAGTRRASAGAIGGGFRAGLRRTEIGLRFRRQGTAPAHGLRAETAAPLYRRPTAKGTIPMIETLPRPRFSLQMETLE